MNRGVILAAPHTHDASSVQKIMFTVVLAALPATAIGVWAFGWPAAHLLMITVLSAVGFEAIALWLRGKEVGLHLADGSCVLAGWLLALTLPPWAPWWIGVLGAGFAILVGKHVFGGIGQNLFNPAMLARVALLLAFPVEMTSWPEVLSTSAARLDPMTGLAVTFGSSVPDAVSGATLLATQGVGASAPSQWLESSLVVRAGSLGEASAPWILLGGVLLWWRRIISWHIPVAVVAGTLLPAAILHWIEPSWTQAPLVHLVSGGLLLTAIFIATDPTTSPSSPWGKVVFGLGVGGTLFVIRAFGSLPEGAAFSVLIMNSLVPILDRKLRPRVYGRTRSGNPMPVPGGSR